MMKYKIACIVPTYNGRVELERLLRSLNIQKDISFETIIIDSSSTDGTSELAKSFNCKVLSIPKKDFNHGGTRQYAINENPNYDLYILLTQDAYLEDESSLKNITLPFQDETVGAVYGRQLPHVNANKFAAHARLFNYGTKSQQKDISNSIIYGIKTPFLSNSFSAYRREMLESTGGFPEHVILSEDMYVGAKSILSDWKIFYASNAECRHSHNYTIREEFRRYFDIGVFHAREPWIVEAFGGTGGEGLRFVKSEIKYLGLSNIHLWPLAGLRNFLKILAYKLGKRESLLSIGIKSKLSMHKAYWRE
ncbi:glycosyltransferase family 2 protein [Pseudomonas nitroreducens]|uniref:glycosyltransferase n=1 Tax=Pseudomonas nitroreducens TaxID=46680 RepID=UPI0023F9C509|nr:glycosyltransferase family 2 protein [Pseudomonas nitroreducens]WEX00936.1 glycosyltransferase family 2 protein [Pseudomonas nitroreducens]